MARLNGFQDLPLFKHQHVSKALLPEPLQKGQNIPTRRTNQSTTSVYSPLSLASLTDGSIGMDIEFKRWTRSQSIPLDAP